MKYYSAIQKNEVLTPRYNLATPGSTWLNRNKPDTKLLDSIGMKYQY